MVRVPVLVAPQAPQAPDECEDVIAAVRDLELEVADLRSIYGKLEADFGELLTSYKKLQASHEELKKQVEFQEQDSETYEQLVLQHVVHLVHIKVQAVLGIEKPENELWSDYIFRVSRDNFRWFVEQDIFTDLHLLIEGSGTPFAVDDGAAGSPALEVMESIVQSASVSEPGWARLWQLVVPPKEEPSEDNP